MPPKRTPASKQAPTKPRTTPKRSRKAAGSKTKSTQHDNEVETAFKLYAIPLDQLGDDQDEDDAESGLLRVQDVRRCLTALNLPKPPADFFDDDQQYLSLPGFLQLAQTLRELSPGDESDEGSNGEAEARRSEINHAFALFAYGVDANGQLRGSAEGQSERRITLADLKRVAKELREDVDEKVLKMMIEEANADTGNDIISKGVDRQSFEEIMTRAGVFG